MFIHRLRAIFLGDLVGTDANGTRYYKGRYPHPITGRKQRWAVYTKGNDATCVPPKWHLWLHHTQKKLPDDPFTQPITQKPHTYHNNSGTDRAYWPVFIQKICFNVWKPKKHKNRES